MKLRPPIPWTGSKRRFASKIISHFPSTYGTYYEPFIGAGSIFLTLQPRRAVISDNMCHIVSLWKAIKSNVQQLIEYLRKYKTHSQTTFNKVKNMLDNKTYKNNAQHAAAFIYLIKTAFRGIYSENKSGTISSTFIKSNAGKKFTYDYENLINIHKYMKKSSITIKCCSYEKVLGGVGLKKNDLVYLDPPYVYTDVRTNKITYGFRKNVFDNELLFDIMNHLDKRGIRVIMSNSYHPSYKKKLNKNYKLVNIAAINGFGDLHHVQEKKHKKQKEIILYNYFF